MWARLGRPVGKPVGKRALSSAPVSGIEEPRSLEGQIAWVIGGAGLIGTGIVRGLLRAGATVLCNSRHGSRLRALSEELQSPENLVTIQGSMLPEGAEDTVAAAMELTAGRIDHVVTHSAVRWWARAGECDETSTIATMNSSSSGVLSLTHGDFASQAMQLPLMQFAAARLLVPRLQQVPHASYTFVTGGAGEAARSPIGQINAQAVWGLAAALRNETRGSPMRMNEVRLGLRFNRSVDSLPLSHDVGHICAGLAAAPHTPNVLHCVNSQEDIAELKRSFPAQDKGYPVYFSPDFL